MKAFIKLTILLNFFITSLSFGSHIKGGEITWQCQGNGQYVFYLRLYRDCNGIPLGWTSYNINISGNPSLTTIPINLITVNDLTPPGCGNSCGAPNGYAGALEEDIFRSNPVTLSGTPPPTGWIFYWDAECCRANADNLVNEFNTVIRSVMYAYNGLDANPCFDSSPSLTEKPVPAICIGYNYTYNIIAYDTDHDSLSYKFDYIYDNGSPGNGPGNPLQYVNPYSYNNPLPGNPMVDSFNGSFTFFPPAGTPQGDYSISIKASSYRCGQIISEVSREILITLHASGCTGVVATTGSTINHPPQINPAPFQDPNTGFYTSYIDTVNVGDTINFSLNITEFEQDLNSMQPQQFWIDMFGSEMDSGSAFPYTECALPPCAHLNNPTPQGPFQLAHQMQFNWITDCAHPYNSCGKEYTPYYFVVSVKDDACPIAATNNITITVVVRGLEIIANGNTLSVNTPYTNLQWYLNGIIIPGAISNVYIATVPGDYSVTAITPIGCTVSSSYRIQTPVSINAFNVDDNLIMLSPNPVASNLKITLPDLERKTVIKIFNKIGSQVIEKEIISNDISFEIDVSKLPSGIYTLTVNDMEYNYRKMFVVMHH